jgi:tetratricopeptide (TPR) repeat protein
LPLYQQTLRDSPSFLPAILGLGSIRAASHDATLRNGQEAVGLATEACRLAGNRDPRALDLLGAACAEAGRFSEAVSASQQALGLARSAGNHGYAQAIAHRLGLYGKGQPFRDSGLWIARGSESLSQDGEPLGVSSSAGPSGGPGD